ncbi:MAG: DUF1592 domain-containing protein [Verrucomicrobiales bacterium]
MLVFCSGVASGLSAPDEYAADVAGFREVAQPFLQEHCVACHGAEKQKGKFRVDEELPNDFLTSRTAEMWAEVLNVVRSHEMPPEDEPQPDAGSAGRFGDWVAAELIRAEKAKRSTAVVLRRMNRAEYVNTVRDLLGVELDPERFPEDPQAGGFDNIGEALTISPLHLEMYFDAAREAFDRAFVSGDQPAPIRWRFEPEEDPHGADRTRVARGESKHIIVNKGKNPAEGGHAVMHHRSWDRNINVRNFNVPTAGEYIIRIRAKSRVPGRDAVVAAMEKILGKRRDEEIQKRPERERYIVERYGRDLGHFQTDRMYDYGPGRLQVVKKLAGQPETVAEFDVDGSGEFEIRTEFTTESAGFTLNYAYSVPGVLENFWCQGKDEFPRPEVLVDWIELEGPVHDRWPPASQVRLLERGEDARALLAEFMPRAWRRPVTDEELDAKVALFEKVRPDKDSFIGAIKVPLVAVLTSPNFLYLPEGGERLDDFQLASRLSYFLWSSTPDARLFQLAESGDLRLALGAEVDRMLKDERSEAFVTNFAGQWLDLRKIGANPPAQNLFPRYDRHLEISIAEESLAFFREVLRGDLNVMNFVKSEFVTVNERLARFYGIGGVEGDGFRRVAVGPDVHRGGIVTQASVLSTTSNGTRTSPVVRGAWVMKNLLGTDPGLPVANAGEIQPKVPGIDKATVRDRLEIHRTAAQCARCHDKIDPLGFALENFNAAGEWREQEGFGYNGRIGRDDPAIDASARLPDGTEFVGVAGLQAAMLDREELFLRCLAEKLFTYALGRELGFSDAAQLNRAVAHLRGVGDYRLRALIKFIVGSELFRSG